MTNNPASVGRTSSPTGPARNAARAIVLLIVVAAFTFVTHDTNHPWQKQFFASDSLVSDSVGSPYTMEVGAFISRFRERARKLERAQRIASYARHYRISSKMATDIFSTAENVGLDPELAFRVVKAESGFDESATSPVGAIGLTQLMLATAQDYDESLTVERLYDRRTNLKIGLSYLRALIDQFDGNVDIALAAYNRGPGYITGLLAQGRKPNNAYERLVLSGYTGSGIMD